MFPQYIKEKQIRFSLLIKSILAEITRIKYLVRVQILVSQLALDPYTHFLTSRMATFARGARLNLERLLKLKIGQHLQPREREVLITALFNRKEALA